MDWLSSGRGSGGMRDVREEPLRLNSGLRVWLGIGRDTKVFYSSLCSTLFALRRHRDRFVGIGAHEHDRDPSGLCLCEPSVKVVRQRGGYTLREPR